MKRIPVALALLAVALSARADEVETLRKLDHDMSVATWTGDVAWFQENVAEEFVLISATGQIKSKKQAIDDLNAPGFAMEPYEPHEVMVRILGDTALVTGRNTQKFTMGTAQIEADMRYTEVFIKRKGRWLLVSMHASPISIKVKKP